MVSPDLVAIWLQGAAGSGSCRDDVDLPGRGMSWIRPLAQAPQLSKSNSFTPGWAIRLASVGSQAELLGRKTHARGLRELRVVGS